MVHDGYTTTENVTLVVEHCRTSEGRKMSDVGGQLRVTDDAIVKISQYIDASENELRGCMATHMGQMASWQSSWKGQGAIAASVALESYRAKSEKLFALMQAFVSRLRAGNTHIDSSEQHAMQNFSRIGNTVEGVRMDAILGG